MVFPAESRCQVEAEAADDLAEQFDISVVPTFVFLRVCSLQQATGGLARNARVVEDGVHVLWSRGRHRC